MFFHTDDLYDIFMRYYDYNPDSVPEKSVLEGCIAEMYGVRYATSMWVAGQIMLAIHNHTYSFRELETVAGSLIYPLITQASSLLEDELEVNRTSI